MNDHTAGGFSDTSIDSNGKNLMFLEVMPRTSPKKAVILEEKFVFHKKKRRIKNDERLIVSFLLVESSPLIPLIEGERFETC